MDIVRGSIQKRGGLEVTHSEKYLGMHSYHFPPYIAAISNYINYLHASQYFPQQVNFLGNIMFGYVKVNTISTAH